MGGEVVHHDGGPRLVPAQSGDQDLLQKGLKHGPIGGDRNGHDSNQPTKREGAEHGETAPMTGGAAVGALVARRARIKPRQLGADAGLVAKDQSLGRDALDLLGKACPWQGTGGDAFGNDIGAPGTILTFFPWPNAGKGRIGAGEVIATAFSIPAGSSVSWKERLKTKGVSFSEN